MRLPSNFYWIRCNLFIGRKNSKAIGQCLADEHAVEWIFVDGW